MIVEKRLAIETSPLRFVRVAERGGEPYTGSLLTRVRLSFCSSADGRLLLDSSNSEV